MTFMLRCVVISLSLIIQTCAEITVLGPWIDGSTSFTGAGQRACDQLGGINVADRWCIVKDNSLTYCCILMTVLALSITWLLAYRIWKTQDRQDVTGTSRNDMMSV